MSDPVVQDFPANWHSVTCGDWCVTVGPDGNIRLPQLVRLEDVDDFVAAILAAKPVAAKQVGENKKKAAKLSKDDRVQRMELLQHNMVRRDALRPGKPGKPPKTV